MGRLGLALGLVCLLAQAASASHYRLPASGIANKTETAALAKQKVTTTKTLLKAAAKSKARRALSKSTGITATRLFEMASLCDLLRVDGIGPSVARLLTASGVSDSGALRKQGAGALLGKMRTANSAHGIMEVLPSEQTLASWIKRAAGLSKLLEGER